MKALTITGVKQIEMIEKPIPQADERFSVIKNSYAGICGSDLHMMWQAGWQIAPNYVIGHEFSGVISETLPGSGFEVGDRVVAIDLTPAANVNTADPAESSFAPTASMKLPASAALTAVMQNTAKFATTSSEKFRIT